MLFIVIKTQKNSEAIDINTTISTIPTRLKGVVTVLEWQPRKRSNTSTQELTAWLSTQNVKDGDFVMIVLPGTIFTKYSVERFTNPRWFDSSNRIRVAKGTTWSGVNPIAVQYDLLASMDFLLDDFGQDARARYFLSALRHEYWYSTIDTQIHLPHYETALSKMTVENVDLYEKSWYINFQKNWNGLFQEYGGVVPRSVQQAYVYMLQWRLIYNINGNNKFVLQDKDVKTFYAYLRKNLEYIEDAVLLRPARGIKMDRVLRLFLLKEKHTNREITYHYSSRNIIQALNGVQVDSAVNNAITIESMDYFDQKLVIAGFTQFDIDPNHSYVVCRCGDVEYELPDARRYGSYSVFGKEIHRNRTFLVEIPSDVISRSEGISFHIISTDQKTDVRMKLAFTRAMSKLNNDEKSYWNIKDLTKIIKYKGRIIWITPNTPLRRIYHEVRYVVSLLFFGNNTTRNAAILRMLYYLSKPLFTRDIWLFSDKPYKAGDNGEYLWRYALSRRDGTKKYYVLNKKSPDAGQFRREKISFVSFGSLWHKLIFLNATIVFATVENQVSHNSIKYEAIYLRDKFDYLTLFIQHGLTVQKLSSILNRYNDNVKKYFIASRFEYYNLLTSDYGYTDEDIMRSGLPRYDGLVSRRQKQILIAPTWRKYLAATGRGDGNARVKVDRFRSSDYHNLYSRLINDERLIDTANKNGYKITYLLHPITSSQKDDFRPNSGCVQVIASTSNASYEKLLTESDLMVTDYSGVQFDFAYMNKPVVYYHPEKLPPTYEEAVYNYEEHALGEIINTHDALIERLCWYMENGCEMPVLYQKRAKDFFYHHDHNNAKRIYDQAIRFTKQEYGNSRKSELVSEYKKVVKNGKYIRHALGSMHGKLYLNSIQAMGEWYKRGDRIYEVDVAEATNGELVLFHPTAKAEPSGDRNKGLVLENNKVNYSQFLAHKMFGKYSTSTFQDLVNFMKSHPDVYVLIDSGRQNYKDTSRIYAKIVHSAGDDVLQRLIVGGHTTEMMRAVRDIYDFSLYNFYYAADRLREGRVKSPEQFIRYCEVNGFTSLSISADRYTTGGLAAELGKSSLMVYVFTTDNEREATEYFSGGATAVGSNTLR